MFLEICSPLNEKVKSERVGIYVEYSFPCVLESLPMTHECPHPPYLSLNYEFCLSLPLTKKSMGSQIVPHRSQLEPRTQPISFNNITSKFNGFTHSNGERIDYIIPNDIWMGNLWERYQTMA
jgi:hypothetical protein